MPEPVEIPPFEGGTRFPIWDVPSVIDKASRSYIAQVFQNPLYRTVINSDAFQRLRRIRFLGAIEYCLPREPKDRSQAYTRFHHSLGVAWLTINAARWMELDEHLEQNLVVAALLHDIGHGPLSHSIEGIFKEAFRIDHHRAGEAIIKGDAPVGRHLPKLLKLHGVDADTVLNLIRGTSNQPGNFLFASPLNVDTIEAIWRSYRYISTSVIEPPPIVVLLAAWRRNTADLRILDGFWRLKGIVYKYLIQSEFGKRADLIAESYIREHINEFSRESFFLTDTELRRAHGRLFRRFAAVRRQSGLGGYRERDVFLDVRRFFIDEKISATDRDNDAIRYRQTTVPHALAISSDPLSLDRPTSRQLKFTLGAVMQNLPDLSEKFPNIQKGRAYSQNAVKRLREVLAEHLDNDFLLGTCGSFARYEASSESDLDYFAICRTDSELDVVCAKMDEIRPLIRKIVPKAAAAGGAFEQVESLEAMLRNIGGAKDQNDKFTRRILCLLESEWLHGEEILVDVRGEILRKYIRDTITDHQLALFLLNDIVRYYRTICVDFEFKTAEAGKPWGTRNVKLGFSRKLIYFSGVLAVGETHYRTAAKKRERLEELFSMPVIDRIQAICGARADRALGLYDEFLAEFAKKEVREACDTTTEESRLDSEIFRYLKNRGHEFSNHLLALLSDTYHSGHPIHQYLIV
jgi:hypothetical protein